MQIASYRVPLVDERVFFGLCRHSSISLGQAAAGRFPDIRRSAIANDRSHRKRMGTCDPELPFTSPRTPCRILGLNGHLSSPEVYFSDGSNFTGVRAVDFSFPPDSPQPSVTNESGALELAVALV